MVFKNFNFSFESTGKDLDETLKKASEKFDTAFKEMSEGFEEVDNVMNSIFTKTTTTKTSTIEVYGDTKQQALDEINKLSVLGYILDSIKEDKEKGCWAAKATLKVQI